MKRRVAIIWITHPGYITWDALANRKRLAANRTNSEVPAGPSRVGLRLLQGPLLCGTCGRSPECASTGNGGLYPIYQCNGSIGAGAARRIERVVQAP